MDEQSPGTSTNVCGFLSVFIYGHPLNFEAAPPWDRQDRTGVTFIVESPCDFDWITGIDQSADTRHGRAVDLIRTIPRRVLDDVPKLHDDQWVVHAVLSLSSFSGSGFTTL